MIKNYLMLNDEEKEKLYEFINRENKEVRTAENIEMELCSEVYEYGKGILIYFEGDTILGKVSVVLEVAEVLKSVYIHSVDLLEEAEDKVGILNSLIEESFNLTNKYELENLLLGIRSDKVLAVANELGLYTEYLAYKMVLVKKDKKVEPLDIVPLREDNIEEYVDSYNKSFMDMPHGTYLSINEAREFIKNIDSSKYYFMVSVDNVNIGFLNVEIKDQKGEFDIGLCKEFRGMGYGKRLLETAIVFLNNRVSLIGLTVIQKNEVAFNMYKKRGFVIDSTLSHWIKLK